MFIRCPGLDVCHGNGIESLADIQHPGYIYCYWHLISLFHTYFQPLGTGIISHILYLQLHCISACHRLSVNALCKPYFSHCRHFSSAWLCHQSYCHGAGVRPLTQVSQKPLHGSRPKLIESYLSIIFSVIFFSFFKIFTFHTNFQDFFFSF